MSKGYKTCCNSSAAVVWPSGLSGKGTKGTWYSPSTFGGTNPRKPASLDHAGTPEPPATFASSAASMFTPFSWDLLWKSLPNSAAVLLAQHNEVELDSSWLQLLRLCSSYALYRRGKVSIHDGPILDPARRERENELNTLSADKSRTKRTQTPISRLAQFKSRKISPTSFSTTGRVVVFWRPEPIHRFKFSTSPPYTTRFPPALSVPIISFAGIRDGQLALEGAGASLGYQTQ
ncbi:hypothetical protein FA13DRAFT_1715907 [Coprinellus micaceus]|uniref:Uncharacterized protein n=1 Tax=Coprinellus micaceus TaxID=71717 RepID=A0A4Y7SLV8_COPMI|nr:hypothetical protein FA13DRAFT_1715907 [Coprinellus micaceus]